MIAIPIIDIMIGFIAFPPSPSVIQGVVERQYEFFGEVGVHGRLYLRRLGFEFINLDLIGKGGTRFSQVLPASGAFEAIVSSAPPAGVGQCC
jgi:hypothetical protein